MSITEQTAYRYRRMPVRILEAFLVIVFVIMPIIVIATSQSTIGGVALAIVGFCLLVVVGTVGAGLEYYMVLVDQAHLTIRTIVGRKIIDMRAIGSLAKYRDVRAGTTLWVYDANFVELCHIGEGFLDLQSIMANVESHTGRITVFEGSATDGWRERVPPEWRWRPSSGPKPLSELNRRVGILLGIGAAAIVIAIVLRVSL